MNVEGLKDLRKINMCKSLWISVFTKSILVSKMDISDGQDSLKYFLKLLIFLNIIKDY